jgi:hypothetical protein
METSLIIEGVLLFYNKVLSYYINNKKRRGIWLQTRKPLRYILFQLAEKFIPGEVLPGKWRLAELLQLKLLHLLTTKMSWESKVGRPVLEQHLLPTQPDLLQQPTEALSVYINRS